MKKILRKFFSKVYNIIHEENYDRIIKENEEENDNEKEIIYFKKLIKRIIHEKNKDNCKLSFKMLDESGSIYSNYFLLNNLDVIHEIEKFNGLLHLKIIFNLDIKIYIRSGNSIITFSDITLDYENGNQEIKINLNLTCNLINNNLGNYSKTYCTCGSCINCKNRLNPFPFDDLLNYLREKNNIKYNPEYSQLWFGKYNSYRNVTNYKCSYCTDFSAKKLNIVKLYCIDDEDHSCIIWVCLNCYKKKRGERKDEICPNCKKFIINFSCLKSIFRHK